MTIGEKMTLLKNFQFKMRKSCFLLLLFFCSCKSIVLKVNEGERASPYSVEDEYLVGVSKIDITPPVGSPMAGYGKDLGKIGRGFYNRLWAKSTFIQNKDSSYMILVATDLWAFPAGLGDYVVNQLHQSSLPFKVNRNKVIFSASHTHHSPGNYMTSSVYNLFSSRRKGFDEELFTFLGDRIAYSIQLAIQERQATNIFYTQKNVKGLSRNRSLEAFRFNPVSEQLKIVNQIQDVSAYWDPAHCLKQDSLMFKAIDPRLTLLLFKNSSTDELFHLMYHFGGHPTTMGKHNLLYGGDLTGFASNLVELYLGENAPFEIPVSFFNGAAGDVSMNWEKQGFEETRKLSEILAVHIIDALSNPQTLITGAIAHALNVKSAVNFSLEDGSVITEVFCKGESIRQTGKQPKIGITAKVGAEDGRTKDDYNECGKEGRSKVECDGPHGNKIDNNVESFGVNFIDPPELMKVGYYELGSLKIVTMPGEVTVALAERFKTIARDYNTDPVLLFSMTNGYLSYFTTAEEYQAQNYEGASNLFGMATGAFLQNELFNAKKYHLNATDYFNKNYIVGPKLKIDRVIDDINKINTKHSDIIDGFKLQGLTEGADYIIYEWPVPIKEIHKYKKNHLTKILPKVSVRSSVDHKLLESRRTLISSPIQINIPQEDSFTDNIWTYIKTKGENDWVWETIYLIPKGLNHKSINIKFEFDNYKILSPQFLIP